MAEAGSRREIHQQREWREERRDGGGGGREDPGTEARAEAWP